MSIKFRVKLKNGWTVDSPLEQFFFPDGAAHIKGVEKLQGMDVAYHIADVRGLSHGDLFTLAMWEAAADGPKVLMLPYLPGARADRGVPNGASVYATFLDELHLDQIITLDPHSEVMPDYFEHKELTVFPVERIIAKEVQDRDSDQRHQSYVGVIAPDKGAVDRASRAAKVMGVPVLRAEKTRDFETGALTGFHMVDELNTLDNSNDKYLIVDDICDGGGTFIGLAEATGLPPERLDLWVTHGIFSKGLDHLFERFGAIHTTDSYFDQNDELAAAFREPRDRVQVHRVLPYLTSAINVGEIHD